MSNVSLQILYEQKYKFVDFLTIWKIQMNAETNAFGLAVVSRRISVVKCNRDGIDTWNEVSMTSN